MMLVRAKNRTRHLTTIQNSKMKDSPSSKDVNGRTTSNQAKDRGENDTTGNHATKGIVNPRSTDYEVLGLKPTNTFNILGEWDPVLLEKATQTPFHDHDRKLGPSLDKHIDRLLKSISPETKTDSTQRAPTPEGLAVPLLAHQEVALDWMQRQERGTNKGGILADEMGLGKTLSAISLILARPSTEKHKVSCLSMHSF